MCVYEDVAVMPGTHLQKHNAQGIDIALSTHPAHPKHLRGDVAVARRVVMEHTTSHVTSRAPHSLARMHVCTYIHRKHKAQTHKARRHAYTPT
jgi:hypothetical protein